MLHTTLKEEWENIYNQNSYVTNLLKPIYLLGSFLGYFLSSGT